MRLLQQSRGGWLGCLVALAGLLGIFPHWPWARILAPIPTPSSKYLLTHRIGTAVHKFANLLGALYHKVDDHKFIKFGTHEGKP